MKIKKKLIESIKHPSMGLYSLVGLLKALSINIRGYFNHLRNKKNLVFDMTHPGEFYYIEPIWNELKTHENLKIYFSVKVDNDVSGFFWSDYMSVFAQFDISKRNIISHNIKPLIQTADLFLSPTAWTRCIPGNIPKIQIFHGLASKNRTLLDNVLQFNILFLTGPNLKEMYQQEFTKKYPEAKNMQIFEVGYPKSDTIINGLYNKEKIIKELSIDPNKPTVIYAPTYDHTASLHKMGDGIIQTLAKMNINLLIKLHPGSLRSPNNFIGTGGIDWIEKLKKYQQDYPNVKPIFDKNSNQYLYISDVMITDVSGVGFEFMLLDKPLIYVDVPEFFRESGHGGIDDWGRYAGIIVKKPEELHEAVQRAFDNPMEQSPQRRELISKLIYNPGNSAEKAAEIITQLLRGKWEQKNY